MTCSSDERLKANIADSASVLEHLNGFRIRNYDVLASGDHMTGVIAQEVMQDYPELVSVLPGGMYSVQLPNQWKLVKGIQELDIRLHDIEDFKEEGNSFGDKLREWLGSSSNGIRSLFVKDTICIGETCIDEDQLKALIQGASGNNNEPEPETGGENEEESEWDDIVVEEEEGDDIIEEPNLEEVIIEEESNEPEEIINQEQENTNEENQSSN